MHRIVLALFGVLIPVAAVAKDRASHPNRVGSALVLDEVRQQLHVADADLGEVVTLDAKDLTKSPSRVVHFGGHPGEMVRARDGALFVVVPDTEQIVRIGADGSVRMLPLPGEPFAISLSDRAETIFVPLHVADEVVAIDVATFEEKWRVQVPPRPRRIAFLGGDRVAIGHDVNPTVTVLDAGTGLTMSEIRPAISSDRVAVRAWPFPVDDTLQIYSEDVQTGFKGSTRPSGGYGGSQTDNPIFARVTPFHLGSLVRAPGRLRLDANEVLPAATNLVAAVEVPMVDYVAVASVSSGSVLFLGRDRPDCFSAHTITGVDGPTALAASALGRDLFVLSSFSRKVTAYRLQRNGSQSGREAYGDAVSRCWGALGSITKRKDVGELLPSTLSAQAQRGRLLFHTVDPRRSSVGFACVSCHPDGREDGLVWNLEGGRRQTISLAGRLHGTAPFNWIGTGATLEDNIAQTIRRMGGHAVTPPEDLEAIAAYLREGLVAAPRHTSASGLVDAGRAVFESEGAGCSACHDPARAFTDGLGHDVGTTTLKELAAMRRFKRKATPADFDTPSLLGLARTAPYLHDGSAPDLETLLAVTDGHMGSTGHLAPEERTALVAYLQSL